MPGGTEETLVDRTINIDESARKKRRTIQFAAHSTVELQDCNDEVERQKIREDEIGRRTHISTPRRSSFSKPSSSRYISVGGLPGASLAQAKPLSADELESLHRSCMEMNQSNRINAQNSWNLKLIDYLQEVMNSSLSQNQNFQVASVTIECSVKIYSSRVDSLESESLRVAGSLHRNDAKQDDAPGRNEAAVQREQPAKRTHHAATLEANPDNLDVRNVEAQFDVDPLFRITCSKFDAGGAAGLLLNNIRIGPYCQLMLDSSIVASAGEIDEEELWGGLNQKNAPQTSGEAGGDGEDDDVNDAELQDGPIAMDECPPEGLPLPERPPSLAMQPVEDDGQVPPVPLPATVPDVEAAALDVRDDSDDWGDANCGNDLPDDEATPALTFTKAEDVPQPLADDVMSEDMDQSAVQELHPAPDIEAEYIEKNANVIADLVDGGNDFSYFSRDKVAQLKEPHPAEDEEMSDCDSEIENMAPAHTGSWTGMSGHWKFRAVQGLPGDDATMKVKEERKKKKKESCRIDFTAELTEAQLRAFAPPSDPFCTLLKCGKERAKALSGKISGPKQQRILALIARGTDPKAMLNRAKRKCLHLPDDNHFDLNSLFQPFTRTGAEWNLKLRALRRKQHPNADANLVEPQRPFVEPCAGPLDDAPDVAFAELNNVLPELQERLDHDMASDGGANDFDDGPDMDDDFLNITHVEDELRQQQSDPAPHRLSISITETGDLPLPQDIPLGNNVELVQVPEQANTIKVNYSKVAKQIDIKRLKDCMWNRICDAFDSEDHTGHKRKAPYVLSLTDLIESMRDDVQQLGNAAEITISFYFISLLHLANEKNLELQGLPCLTNLHILNPNS